ncbi:hypothetical protein ACNQ62_05395 [Sulfitobacter sp. SBS6]|uniref:hypothetical protein n=1 Tax=Sulfitobacter sp. SBS6 TaxID=3401755 RepID=UPI003AAB09C9
MRTTFYALTAAAVFVTTTAKADPGEIISIDDGALLVCRSYSTAQTMYALVANDRDDNVNGCWVVDPPMEVIVLQDGPRLSSITYRDLTTEAEIARMVASGASELMLERVRANPWSAWYQSPAWAFTEWLKPE